ncbi:hypothetical protein H7U20_04920 [Rugamonas sp. CCM 8940]|uniref:hypothetical protein n=1 Tax=Rugamonas sp. CCM 8940 TaxID=2765359 RepID=UPI0018F580F0|nr:hypothetical protein [Rugamonas sp. CCM 8940]MBJ7309538.1 hypothetical protein [Rugamonas sp. CCM 8940]
MITTPLAVWTGAALLLCASTLVHAAPPPSSGAVGEQLKVNSRDGTVLVQITLQNRSAHPVYVQKSLASATELTGRLFDIVDTASGKSIPYIGMMIKRGPLTAKDYLTLPPHSSHSHTIDITHSYAFAAGPHHYRLSHAGDYLSDLAALEAASPIPPASAEFSHTAPPQE